VSRRSSRSLAGSVALVACTAVTVAVLLAGVVAVGLVRTAYDGRARTQLHSDAVLAARLAERPATSAATKQGRPAARLLSATGIRLLRVRADGTTTGTVPVSAADRSLAAAGGSVQATRTVGGQRSLVDIEPVAADGGVVLVERVTDARAVQAGVLRRIALALAAGLLVALGLALLLARRLARPLEHAATGALRLAAGERDVRVRPEGPVEVAEVAVSINSLAEALAGSESRQRQFLLSVSHELRTPLTAIRGFAEALADGVATGPRVVEAGATIEAEATRLQRLVADLLDLARLGAEDFRLERHPVDLRALLHEAAAVWSARCAAVGVPLGVEEPPGPVLCTTDAGRVRQVLDGLAENALRVTPAGRPIVLALRHEGGLAVLEVRDGGPGLTEDDLGVAFERSALHERYRGIRPVGTGVGLALVGGLVTRLGGSAEAGHAVEGGARFTVRLPPAEVRLALQPAPVPG